ALAACSESSSTSGNENNGAGGHAAGAAGTGSPGTGGGGVQGSGGGRGAQGGAPVTSDAAEERPGAPFMMLDANSAVEIRAGEAGSAGPRDASASGDGSTMGPVRILVFSRTAAYRHDSIPDGLQALTTLATQRGWTLVKTEDPTLFRDDS